MKHFLILLCLLLPAVGLAQSPAVNKPLLGYWEGAFIKQNAYQKFEVEFSQRQDKLICLLIMEEWHPTYGESEVPVSIDSTGLIAFNTGYGRANLRFDSLNLELTGSLVGFSPAVYIHLKKGLPRPQPTYQIEPVSIASGKDTLYGHLHVPLGNQAKTAVLLVGGRGCYADATQYNLYAKVLRRYGVSVLALQKRGTGKSTGNCQTATITQLAADVVSARAFLKNHPNGYQNVGVLGISAGGWVMAKAQEMAPFDFMISVVGPATSVFDQQMQSIQYGAPYFNLSQEAIANLKAYTRLLFEGKDNKKTFAELQRLLALGTQQKWKQLLEDTDLANSQEEIKNLWVRRHNYDPKQVLQNYKKPFLAVYGQKDWIVPHQENVKQLKAYFNDRPQLLTTVVAYNADHGLEMAPKLVNVVGNYNYWHFYRVSPSLGIAIIEFLRKHAFIN